MSVLSKHYSKNLKCMHTACQVSPSIGKYRNFFYIQENIGGAQNIGYYRRYRSHSPRSVLDALFLLDMNLVSLKNPSNPDIFPIYRKI